MRLHRISVRDRVLHADRKIIIPQGSHQQDKIELLLDDDWDGMTVYMILTQGQDKLTLNYAEDSAEGDVTLPDKMLDKIGPISVALVGIGDDGSKITTAQSPMLIRVVSAGATSER